MSDKTPLERAIADKPNESFAVEAILEPMDQDKRKETLAAVEEHYHLASRPIPAVRSFYRLALGGIAFAVLVIAFFVGTFLFVDWAITDAPKPVATIEKTSVPPIATDTKPVLRQVTLDQYYRIKIGMTYKQVVEVCGWEGIETDRSSYGYWMDWKGEGYGGISVRFNENGKVESLFQIGLK